MSKNSAMTKIDFIKIEIQNFYSFGDKQELDLTKLTINNDIILIDGIDLDTEGSKIGSGKSSFFAAFTFALFGETVSNIKVNEVVNYIKGKKALVKLYFKIKKDNIEKMYCIERGRKPSILNVYKKLDESDFNNLETWENLSLANNKDSDYLIEQIIGINFQTFQQLAFFSIANDNNKPYLNLSPANQKKVLEYIFSFDKYEDLKNKIKEDIKSKQEVLAKLDGILSEKKNILMQIEYDEERIRIKSTDYEKDIKERKEYIINKLNELQKIDIEKEKSKLNTLVEFKEYKHKIEQKINNTNNIINTLKNENIHLNNKIKELDSYIKKEYTKINDLKENKCPVCKREYDESKVLLENLKQELISKLDLVDKHKEEIKANTENIKKEQKNNNKLNEMLKEIDKALNKTQLKISEKELLNIDIVIENLNKELDSINNSKNPYKEELEIIIDKKNKIQKEIKEFESNNKVKDEIQVLKLFLKVFDDQKVRGKFLKSFIKQLNEILKEYKSLIPDYNIHYRFNPDFSIRIMKLGKEVTSGSLSNGEKRIGNILIMFSLMKLFKLKNNTTFNYIFLDEVLDNGINGSLLENVFEFIVNISKKEKFNILLISHRDEIKEKIQKQILIEKRHGISKIKLQTE